MSKWKYEILEETMNVVWSGYMEGQYPLEDAQEMNDNALLIAGWSQEEYDEETVSRPGPGCRLSTTRGTN